MAGMARARAAASAILRICPQTPECVGHTDIGAKQLDDHLAPIRRFLHKQVGRPWDKIYSEICSGLRAGHPLRDHLLRHMLEHVSFDHAHASGHERRRGQLFVDARTGLLRIAKPRRR